VELTDRHSMVVCTDRHSMAVCKLYSINCSLGLYTLITHCFKAGLRTLRTVRNR